MPVLVKRYVDGTGMTLYFSQFCACTSRGALNQYGLFRLGLLLCWYEVVNEISMITYLGQLCACASKEVLNQLTWPVLSRFVTVPVINYVDETSMITYLDKLCSCANKDV